MSDKKLKNDYKAQKEILRMETQAMFPFLIEIKNNEEMYYYANCDTDIEYDGKTYIGSYFKITPPERTQTGIKDATITISSLDGEWIVKIRNTQEQSRIKFIATIMYDDDGERIVEPIDEVSFKLTSVNWNDTTIQWTMKFDDMLDVKMPVVKLSSLVCPALF